MDWGIDSGLIDGKVLTSSINNLTHLTITGYGIGDFTGIEDFVSLQNLDCRGNYLLNLDISKLTALIDLNISHNLISNLNVSQNVNLVKLNSSHNKLTSLDVSKNIHLTDLDCSFNELNNLVSQNTSLENLNISHNKLTNIDISENTALIELDLENNGLSTLDVSKNINLVKLNCSYNKLTNLDVSKNINLTDLDCAYNELNNLDTSKNPLLTLLDCSTNKLTTLDISKNVNLIWLYCFENLLTNLNLKNGQNTKLLHVYVDHNSNLSCILVDNAEYSNSNWSTHKDTGATYSTDCTIPPSIVANGDQLYCPQTNINIVTKIDINHDPAQTGTEAIYIQISSGYSNGFDQLTLSNTALHPNITTSWDPVSGKLKLYSSAGLDILYSDFEAAIKDVQFKNSSAVASGTRTFSITIGQANYLPSTGHYYLFKPSIGITWTQAKTAAESSTYYGLKGYLATISAADEAKLSGEQASGAGWIGGSDAETENVWKWVTGPEGLANNGTGTIFWNGLSNGTTPNFAFWNNTEPNQAGDEDYAHITAPGIGIAGSWNDLSNTGSLNPGDNYEPKGYIVEYGGMPGEYPLEIAASTQITIPEATITTPRPICDSGPLTLYAASNAGTIRWYDAQVGGKLLETGNTYTTPIISNTTTYYADAGCEVNRKAVVATVNKTPDAPTVVSDVYRCGTGTVTLQATSNIGIINWFTDPAGGSSVYTGNNFPTPSVSANTTYYAESSDSGCINSNRTPANIIVYTPPVVTDEEVVLCENQTVMLDAKLSGMTYKWSTGETTQTIEVNIKGTYTVDVTSPNPENCTSTKIITVIEYKKPIIKNIDVKNTTITINLINATDYFEYSVDGVNYQTSNTFYDVPGGLQTAYVKAKDNLCDVNEVTQTFIVLVFPSFFTPNNDTHNEFWEVTGMENYPEAQVTIFDRYGKLLAQLSGSKMSWNGTFNNIPLPSSDYWYVLKINDSTPVFTGHFTLKR
ncbi:lectin [Flavobacterium hydrophilum]|uniref:Lectin n=2 Tax=Flavobacterium hydrophilum TaxID=2211445 RepID=A0A2V4C362_9FLAO|nr:lectin [Flavobacterium hydrophilum]